VIDFAAVPRITDRSAASQLPQLAVLSVMAHPELETAEIAFEAISGLAEGLRQLYADCILKALPAELRQNLEARMIKGYEYQSDFARKYYGQGMSEGIEKGRQEGRQEGRREGHEDGLRTAVVRLAEATLKTLAPDDLAKISALTDVQVLTDLVSVLGQARTAFGARSALARALNR
jgi:predicted transposase YdaD